MLWELIRINSKTYTRKLISIILFFLLWEFLCWIDFNFIINFVFVPTPVEVINETLDNISKINEELQAYVTVTTQYAKSKAQEAEKKFLSNENVNLFVSPAFMRILSKSRNLLMSGVKIA